MHVVIYRPSDDGVILSRPLGDDETLDARAFADAVAREWDATIDDGPGHVPNCSGDLRVEFREDPANAVVIWSGRSFYLA